MRIAIIGCGHMGSGLAKRLSLANQLFLYDHHIEKAVLLAQAGFGEACSELKSALHPSEIILLAVKPQNIKQVALQIKDELQEVQTIVSLLAGTTIETLKHCFLHPHIVRMMPNLAIIHGEGVIGLSADDKMKEDGKEHLSKAFEPLGKIHWLPEEKMDALTALTGSGPAFFFAMVEAMVEAGIAMGFNAKDAQGLVYQMLQGSLSLLEKTQKHPGELRWQVASPGGTTIAGLKRLEELTLRGGVINTFLAAYERAKHLSSHWQGETKK